MYLDEKMTIKLFVVSNYYVYILTNWNKTVLYIGVTNNLKRRLKEHEFSFNETSFTAEYKVFYLIYYECFAKIEDAIAREKQLKRWSREKKEVLINKVNPSWSFLNDHLGEPNLL